MSAPKPVDGASRLEALRYYDILDSAPDAAFDDITRLAAYICDTPIALVSFVDEDRQWFKARVGLDLSETGRRLSICAWAILDEEMFEVADTWVDERFADNGLVAGEPFIRFYAGVPLRSAEGTNLGTLCVIDRVPRNLSESQCSALRALGNQVSRLLEGTVVRRLLAEALARFDVLDRSFPSCVSCGDIVLRDSQMSVREFVGEHTPARFHDTSVERVLRPTTRNHRCRSKPSARPIRRSRTVAGAPTIGAPETLVGQPSVLVCPSSANDCSRRLTKLTSAARSQTRGS